MAVNAIDKLQFLSLIIYYGLTAIGLVNGNPAFLTPHNIDVP